MQAQQKRKLLRHNTCEVVKFDAMQLVARAHLSNIAR
jgi:hypothetical protein